MQYRRVGKSGLKTSVLGLGSWLTFGDTLERSEAQRIVDKALDAGINFLDLADGYANGGAESQIGEIIKNKSRTHLVLSSKVFWPMSEDPNDCGLGRKHLLASIERSLRNLRTDYLDIYYCHREDTETPIEETVLAMDDLVKQGKILYWGTSMWRIQSIKKAIRFAKKYGLNPPIVEQLPYNLLERWLEKKMSTYKRLGIGLTTWSPLAGGVLTGKYLRGTPESSRGGTSDWIERYRNDTNHSRVEKLTEMASSLNILPEQLAIAWLVNNQNISSCILGASSAQQLQSNIKALEVDFSSDTQKSLNHLFPR